MAPKNFILTGEHFAGGLNRAKGERNLTPQENIESTFMEYTPEGGTLTALGWVLPSGWTPIETGHGVDGLFVSSNYPDLILKAVNGKIYAAKSESSPFYNVDTGLSITAGAPVLFQEYRGSIYYCNGVDKLGRIAVGQLQNNEAAASATWELNDAEGYRFTNGADKVYCEGDEIDYTAVSTDDLTTVTNGLAHDAGAYVTQYNAIAGGLEPSPGSIRAKSMTFWRDTMWIGGMPDDPNVLRYSKTISSVSGIASFQNHDFSDENNYLIGEGGLITALQATRDRLYVFMKERVHYIGIEMTSSGTEAFSPDRLFTANYGCPNQFCVVEMEDVVVFFTGRRLIRIGYEPNSQNLLPDEKFDEEIFTILQEADANQEDARLHYDSTHKKLYLTFSTGGILRTIIYNNRLDKYSYSWNHDPRCYVSYKNATFFGDTQDDNVFKFGADIDGNGYELEHIYKTGRMDLGNRSTKRFIRGMIEGKIAIGTTINFTVFVNGNAVGGVRTISSENANISSTSTALGSVAVGAEVVGGNAAVVNVYEFRYPFLISSIGEDIQLKFSSFSGSAFWGLDKYQIEGLTYPQVPYKHF